MRYNPWLYNNYGHWALPVWGRLPVLVGILLALAIIWSLAWKGAALWKAARRGEKGWFIVFLIVNTLGILEILYLYVFSKKSEPVAKE